MPYVQHPADPTVIREVQNAEEAKQWTDAGWKKVPQADEAKVVAEAANAQRR